MSQEIQVLLVEDSEDDAFLLLRELKRSGFEPHHTRVDSAGAMQACLQQNWDIIFADYAMPSFTGVDALELLTASGKDIPLIIVSGTISEDVAVQAMRAGAVDYIYKENMARLGPAVEHALRDAQDRKARRQAEADLKASEARFTRFAEHAADVITILKFKPEPHFVYASPSVVQMTGYTPRDFYTNPNLIFDIIFPEDRRRILALIENPPGPNQTIEIRLEHKCGRLVWIEQQIVFVYNERHELDLIESICREITERKRYQLQLETVAWIGSELAKSLILEDVFLRIVEGINRLFDEVASVVVSHYEPETQSIRCIYANSDGQTLDTAMFPALPLAPAGQGNQSTVIHCRTPLIVNDLEKRLKNPVMFGGHGRFAKSAIYVPLQIQGEIYGILQVQSYLDGTFTRLDSNLLTLVGNTLAIALENSKLLTILREANQQLTLAYDTTLEGWARALEMRDQETEGHSQRVVGYTLRLAKAVGIKEEDLIHVRRGALLHDIGKMGIPDTILLKPGPLTEEEWVIMRRHPLYAYNLLSQIGYLGPALDIPYCHHEKWDGSGYPRGLKGEEIPLAARVFAINDVWDALSSDRPYRPRWDTERILAYLKDQSGRHFDPTILDVFLKLI